MYPVNCPSSLAGMWGALERRLEAAEMLYSRRLMRISWTERKSNEEVMEMAEYKRSLLKIIRKRQLKFFEHNKQR